MMQITNTVKRILSMIMVVMIIMTLMPIHAHAAETNNVVDSVVFFSDLHTSKSNSKTSLVTNIFRSIATNSATKVSAVFSVGDVFSSNDSANNGNLSTITNAIRDGLQDSSVHVDYTWSDHDRYGGIENYTGLAYGAGADGIYGNADDDNYYVYFISMSDMTTSPRYGTSSTFSSSKLADFTNAVATLDHSKPLFIASHMPLLDNRGDNGHAYKWFQVISAAAETMDIAFFYGHNHKYDKVTEYYYGKGDTMSIEDNGTTRKEVMNFVHACAGYMEPTSTGSYSSSTTRREVALVVTIMEDSISFVTYDKNGVYTGSIGPVNEVETRDHTDAEGGETPEEPTVPEETEPTSPVEPDVPDSEYQWIALSNGNTYELDTDGIDVGAKYLIVAKSYAKALSAAASKNNAENVSVDGTTIVMNSDAYNWVFTASGSNYTIANNGTYLNRSSSSLAIGSSSNTWTVSHSGNGNYSITQSGSNSWWGGSKYYLRWSNSNGIFQASSTNDTVRLYKLVGSSGLNANYIRLGGETVQSYTTTDAVTLTDVLAKIKIETSSDGVNANGAVLNVTSDMVAWDKVFDGSASGTYTASITCEGKLLGNFTVTITAVEHVYETVIVEATCTKNGFVSTICKICGKTTVEELPALGHDYEVIVTTPTCTEGGYTVHTCVACGDSYTDSYTEATGHSYNAVVTAPTCTEGGYTTYTCACGVSHTADETAALGHAYKSVIVDATCTTDGLVTYTCSCGDSYTEVIPATGKHIYVAETVDATCTAAGSVTYTCDCGATYTEIIPATGHTYHAIVTAPTCTEAGYTTYICVCGDRYVADEVAALGHQYNAVVTAPTCTEAGYTTYTCACGDSYVADEVAALGHKHNAVVTAPTCTKGGYTTYICACGDSYVADEVAALGHQYNAVVTAPTCTKDGYTTYTCACGDTYTADTVAALGHQYTAVEDNGYMVYTCGNCGHSYSEKLTVDLSYDKVTKFANGDSYVITVYSGRKYYALSHENNKISLVQVTVSNNEITSDITEDLVWTYQDSKLFYEDGDNTYYLYMQTSNSWWSSTRTLTVSTTNSTTVSFSSNKLKVGSYYLRYSGGAIKLDRSSTTTYLFQENET